MPEGKLFNCPTCGSALSAQGSAVQIKCPYCGNMVIVPEDLRTPSDTPSAGSSGSSRGLAFIIGVVVVICLAVAILAFGIRSQPNAPTPVAKAISTATPVGSTRTLFSFGGEGTAPGLFQSARHLAAAPDGVIYVDDRETLRIQRFDATGKYVSSWTVDQNLCTNKSASLDSLAADRTGNVYVHYCGTILKYDGASGKLMSQFKGEKTSSINDFYIDQILSPDGGLLALADGAPFNNEVVLKLDANGKVLARFPNIVSAQTPKRPANALTLEPAIDGLGNIFLLNKDDSAVYKYTPDGKYVSKFGSVGSGLGQFNATATHIAVDNQSRVFVTDFSGIKIFDANGTYIKSISDRSVGAIQEIRISDKNEIYIVGINSMIFKLALNE